MAFFYCCACVNSAFRYAASRRRRRRRRNRHYRSPLRTLLRAYIYNRMHIATLFYLFLLFHLSDSIKIPTNAHANDGEGVNNAASLRQRLPRDDALAATVAATAAASAAAAATSSGVASLRTDTERYPVEFSSTSIIYKGGPCLRTQLNCSHTVPGAQCVLQASESCSPPSSSVICPGWNDGVQWFSDALPSGLISATVVSATFRLYGRFNCESSSSPTQAALYIGSPLEPNPFAPLWSGDMPIAQGCTCANCAINVTVASSSFPAGIDYAYGMSNFLRITTTSVICLSRVDIEFAFVRGHPAPQAMHPLAAPRTGGTLLTFSAPQVDPNATLCCTFVELGESSEVQDMSASNRTFACASPQVPHSVRTVHVTVQEAGIEGTCANESSLLLAARGDDGGDATALRSSTAKEFTLTFYDEPKVTSMQPLRGSIFGGTELHIMGGPFDLGVASGTSSGAGNKSAAATAATVAAASPFSPACAFGKAIVRAKIESDSEATCTSPAGSGTVHVQFSMNGVDFVDTKQVFAYEEVQSFVYLLVALLFAIVSVALAVTLRVWLYKRRLRAARTKFVSAKMPLLDDDGTASAAIGTVIDPEEVEMIERIGKGTYGEVYKGMWRGSVVAVKKLPAHNISPAFMADFYKEVMIMSRLRHPNCLQFFGVCMTDAEKDLAILMEYMPRNSVWTLLHGAENTVAVGEDEDILKEHMVDRTRVREYARNHLPWSSRLCPMLMDAARGMDYLHSMTPPIVHRDLKSHNLLVNEQWRVKVCDFGLSKILDASPSLKTLTACGTPCWTAPEVLRSERYTHKADVYSFGVVMWEALTFRDPYEGTPPFQVVFAVGTRGLRPDVPPTACAEFVRLIRAAWHETPSQRPEFSVIFEALEKLKDMDIHP